MTDDVLPYRRFDYFAMQGTRIAPGVSAVYSRIFIIGAYPTRDEVEEACLNKAAHLAVDAGLSWNPFQVNLIFTPTK